MKRICLLITGVSLALLGWRAPGSAQVYDQPGDSSRQGGSGLQDTSLYGGQDQKRDSGMYQQDTSSQMGRGNSGIYNDTTFRQGSSSYSDSTWHSNDSTWRNESGKQGSGMWHDTTGRQGSGMWHDSTDRPGQSPHDKSGTYPDKSGTGSDRDDRTGEGSTSGTMKQGSSSSSGRSSGSGAQEGIGSDTDTRGSSDAGK